MALSACQAICRALSPYRSCIPTVTAYVVTGTVWVVNRECCGCLGLERCHERKYDRPSRMARCSGAGAVVTGIAGNNLDIPVFVMAP